MKAIRRIRVTPRLILAFAIAAALAAFIGIQGLRALAQAQAAMADAASLLDTMESSRGETARLLLARAADVQDMWHALLLCTIAALIAIALPAIAVSRSITKPLRALSDIAEGVAAGDMGMNCAAWEGGDEAGRIAAALAKTAAAIKGLSAGTRQLAAKASNGDLQARADEGAHRGEYRHIAREMNTLLDAAVGPIPAFRQALQEMARGNLSISVDGRYRGDHAGMQAALNDTLRILRVYSSELQRSLCAMAEGDFTQEIGAAFVGDFAGLRNAANALPQYLSDVLRQITAAAHQMVYGMQYISDSTQGISQCAAKQAGAIQSLSSGIAAAESQLRLAAEQTGEAGAQIRKARGESASGIRAMQRLYAALPECDASAPQISHILEALEDISLRISTLALRATAETAHPSASGESLSMMAELLHSLAIQSAGASNEAAVFIKAAAEKAATGMEIADGGAAALQRIARAVAQAMDMAAQAADTSKGQISEIARINQGIRQANRMLQVNAAAAEETTAAAEQLASHAELLLQLADGFRLCRPQGISIQSAPAQAAQRGAPPPSSSTNSRITSNGNILRLLERGGSIRPGDDSPSPNGGGIAHGED